MTNVLFSKAEFYTTVNHLRDLPKEPGVEIAFAGRSNAGKSSAINTLAGRGRFAFVSKTPGRTQHINFFQLGTRRFIVDLPGYGYAKVPLAIRQHWTELLSRYLQTRETLFGMVLIMDIRHPIMPLDVQMLEWFALTKKPVHILLSKADKINRSKAAETLRLVRNYLAAHQIAGSAQIFSSMTSEGKDEAILLLANWLESGEQALQMADTETGQKKSPVKGD
ncbi:ribosome biogenesis GTP-binding protein YihA/YsxC [Nitrosomonas mobilis]|uniref:Probable GTP-binding protein EngB n=1 Tax=Nitrosomonas mobilis TaxID=51642 RepID=A0A1G5SDY5_9PROT|nr:ribosome biogenesis GTP-binding protein YihA/YsxC [Nitrosomonas mobilis]SCZ85406.1 putative GTP-binding protein EngB [Nitrosomonas mobilis]